MPVCSYLVIPDPGRTRALADRLNDIAGCEAAPARNRDLLILVTETPGLEEENALRERIEAMDDIRALLFTFGEIDPETPLADPVKVGTEEGAGS